MTWRTWWIIIILALCIELVVMMLMATQAQAKLPNENRWQNMAIKCEVRGIKRPWKANTGNGYYGGLQFDVSTWKATIKPRRFKRWSKAHLAPRWQQILAAEKLRKRRGLSPWPNCAWAWRR